MSCNTIGHPGEGLRFQGSRPSDEAGAAAPKAGPAAHPAAPGRLTVSGPGTPPAPLTPSPRPQRLRQDGHPGLRPGGHHSQEPLALQALRLEQPAWATAGPPTPTRDPDAAHPSRGPGRRCALQLPLEDISSVLEPTPTATHCSWSLRACWTWLASNQRERNADPPPTQTLESSRLTSGAAAHWCLV